MRPAITFLNIQLSNSRDKNITKNFRSTLELIKLMDGAITSEETKNS